MTESVFADMSVLLMASLAGCRHFVFDNFIEKRNWGRMYLGGEGPWHGTCGEFDPHRLHFSTVLGLHCRPRTETCLHDGHGLNYPS